MISSLLQILSNTVGFFIGAFFAMIKHLRKQELIHAVNYSYFCPYYPDPFEHVLPPPNFTTYMLHKSYQEKHSN